MKPHQTSYQFWPLSARLQRSTQRPSSFYIYRMSTCILCKILYHMSSRLATWWFIPNRNPFCIGFVWYTLFHVMIPDYKGCLNRYLFWNLSQTHFHSTVFLSKRPGFGQGASHHASLEVSSRGEPFQVAGAADKAPWCYCCFVVLDS